MADKIRRSFVLHGVAVSALNGSADDGEQPTSEETPPEVDTDAVRE